MATIPARLAQAARVSTSLAEAQNRSKALYRNWYRSVRRFGTIEPCGP